MAITTPHTTTIGTVTNTQYTTVSPNTISPRSILGNHTIAIGNHPSNRCVVQGCANYAGAEGNLCNPCLQFLSYGTTNDSMAYTNVYNIVCREVNIAVDKVVNELNRQLAGEE